MLYKFQNEAGKFFFVKSPDKFNHDIAVKVCLAGCEDKFSFIENVVDLPEGFEASEIEYYLSPHNFVNEKDDKLIPDISHMRHVDREFMEDMLYLWSKINRQEHTFLVDKIDDNLDFLIKNKNNQEYATEDKTTLSIGRFRIDKEDKKCDCEHEKISEEDQNKIIEEALKAYGKIAKPEDYVFGVCKRLGYKGHIVCLEHKEYWEKMKRLSRNHMFLPDNFLPSYVNPENLDNCIYEVLDENISEKQIINDMVALGFVNNDKFHEYLEKQNFVVKIEGEEEMGCCGKCESCDCKEEKESKYKDIDDLPEDSDDIDDEDEFFDISNCKPSDLVFEIIDEGCNIILQKKVYWDKYELATGGLVNENFYGTFADGFLPDYIEPENGSECAWYLKDEYLNENGSSKITQQQVYKDMIKLGFEPMTENKNSLGEHLF